MAFQDILVVVACLVASTVALESDWNQEMREYILDIHNDYRRGEGGCQMNKLDYSLDLEEHAKYWAERCVFEHEYKDNGENLAWDSSHNPEKDLIKDAAQRWFDEKNDFSYGQNSCSMSCHYTQLVWGKTETVGCYSTRCPDLKKAYKDAWYLVCFYQPKGNWMGENPYEKQCDTPCLEGQTEDNGLCAGKAIGSGVCKDDNENCELWSKHDQCEANPSWMLVHCKKSCNQCE